MEKSHTVHQGVGTRLGNVTFLVKTFVIRRRTRGLGYMTFL